MSRDYSYATVEEAKPDAERYCLRDGRTWIMRRPDGRFVLVFPYTDAIEKHYLHQLGWRVELELTVTIKYDVKPEKYTPCSCPSGNGSLIHPCPKHGSEWP